jgi:hypothetical protein
VRPCDRRTAGEEDVHTYSDHQVNQLGSSEDSGCGHCPGYLL